MTRLTTVKRSIGRYGAALGLIIGASLVGSSMAQAQATPVYPTAFSVNYFNNPGTNGLDDIYIQNDTNNGNSISGTNYCALIYAFYPDQEIVGCCGVAITPNETWTNSIGQLLIHIDTAGPLPTKGTIKVVATNDINGCDPRGQDDGGSAYYLEPKTLQSWITHTNTLGAPVSGTFMTEEPLAQTGEPVTDLANLEFECQTVGPGYCGGAE